MERSLKRKCHEIFDFRFFSWISFPKLTVRSAAWSCSHYLSPVSTALAVLVANLPPVSLVPVVPLDLQKSPRIFEKIRYGPNAIIRGLGEDDSRKNQLQKNLMTLSPFKLREVTKYGGQERAPLPPPPRRTVKGTRTATTVMMSWNSSRWNYRRSAPTRMPGQRLPLWQVLWIRDKHPLSEFLHPGSRIKKIPDPPDPDKHERIFK